MKSKRKYLNLNLNLNLNPWNWLSKLHISSSPCTLFRKLWLHFGEFFFSLIARSSRQRCSAREGIKNFAKLTGKHLYPSLFFRKETLALVFFSKLNEIFKNIYFTEYLRATVCDYFVYPVFCLVSAGLGTVLFPY